jgi:DNA polymerase I
LPTKVNDIFIKYAIALKEGSVPIEELAYTKRLSKNSSEYQHRDTIENSALHLLENEGKYLKAGEILKYVITDYYYRDRKTGSSRDNRAIPIELFDDKNNTYDVRRYTELLAKTCNSVTEPFGHNFALQLSGICPFYMFLP